jgi:hypothetical protein
VTEIDVVVAVEVLNASDEHFFVVTSNVDEVLSQVRLVDFYDAVHVHYLTSTPLSL